MKIMSHGQSAQELLGCGAADGFRIVVFQSFMLSTTERARASEGRGEKSRFLICGAQKQGALIRADFTVWGRLPSHLAHWGGLQTKQNSFQKCYLRIIGRSYSHVHINENEGVCVNTFYIYYYVIILSDDQSKMPHCNSEVHWYIYIRERERESFCFQQQVKALIRVVLNSKQTNKKKRKEKKKIHLA